MSDDDGVDAVMTLSVEVPRAVRLWCGRTT